MTKEVKNKAMEIARLNDQHRRAVNGWNVTPGVLEMGDLVSIVFIKVKSYSDFNEDNDPYGEHDFGSFQIAGNRIFWKIDYYDESLSRWCDPLDPRCRRMLTVMRADEY